MRTITFSNETLFNSNFSKISPNKIVSEIRNKGYFSFEKALGDAYIDKLLQEIDFNKILLNTNDVGVVKAYNINFLTHCLATSKITYDIVTSEIVLNICKAMFTDTFRLTNHRIYETCKYSAMPWHTDNNMQEGDNLSDKHAMPGLLFLFYLTDVDKNAFQFIKDSHNFSKKYGDEIYLSENYIENTYSKDIVTFVMKKGSLIITDIHGIHRAEPFTDKHYKRITLLFQVDQVGCNYEGHGEKNIINTEYVNSITPDITSYLGFGCRRDYPAFPNTSISTMSINDIFRLQKKVLSNIFLIVTKSFIKTVIPSRSLLKVKQLRWRFRKSLKRLK